MKRILTIAILLIVPFVLTACTKQQGNLEAEKIQNEDKTTQKQETAGNKKTNLFNLLKSQDAVKCTYTFENENVAMNGTVYVNGKNARTDIINKVAGQEQQDTHSVVKDNWMYIWTGQQKQGMKMEVPENEGTDTENTQTPGEAKYQGLMEDYSYNCSPWNVDPNVFDLPADITFADLSNMVEGFKDEACKLCDSENSAEEKATCRNTLNCN